MTTACETPEARVSEGAVPGAVALVARGEPVEVQAVGAAAVGGAAPMARDSIFRIASITKPITAAAVMILVDDGRVALEDPVERWLPELASRVVVRTPASPVDDVVPAVTADHRAGPAHVARGLRLAVGLLVAGGPAALRRADQAANGSRPDRTSGSRALARPAALPAGRGVAVRHLLGPPGHPVARASGQSLPEFFAERLFEPLGMVDTGFVVPAAKRDRLTQLLPARATAGSSWPTRPTGS